MGAHRASYILHKGDIPDSLLVMHSCDNPLCVNPNHLSLGTPKENMDDMDRKGRRVTGAARGTASALAKLNDDSVRYIRAHASEGAASLGEMFGVHRKTVEAILVGKTWRHVT